ncbi:protein STAR1 isoform X2 [Oryza brachyantha]|uniref:ABC transporter domain-containing protein n=1 Tax=Oryza brachyantha TaxID=4533 RepID=J3MH61_ORYBR|nr:protein STAR1 isoform X2 [Oryza brachyantha]
MAPRFCSLLQKPPTSVGAGKKVGEYPIKKTNAIDPIRRARIPTSILPPPPFPHSPARFDLLRRLVSPMGSASENGVREHLLDVDGGEGEGAPAAVAGMPKIRVRGLSRRSEASGEEILRGVDLDVPRGVVVGVIGPSGSGKSTLLRALNRLWEPAPGAVLLDGVDICAIDVLALRRRVGMLFQLPAMFDGTVADNVRYGPQLRGKKLTDAEVQSLLSLADLDPALCSRPASELSVGQAQRVALARTLANDPEVLLLDEPTSALDPISTQNIEEAIVRLKKTRGLTTVMVSHSVKQIQRIADLVCLVVAGEVVEVLPPSGLSEAKHPMARRFLELS